MLSRSEALSCALEIGLAKLMEADGFDLLVQKVQERLFPQRTAEARELLKQGMRIGGPMSRVAGEPMTRVTSCVVVAGGLSCTRWDNTLELGDTVQGSMMLEQVGTQPVRAEHFFDVYQRTTHHDSLRKSPARTAL